MTIRLLIAEDHTILREGLKRILGRATGIEIVAEAIDGDETLAAVRRGGLDQVLLDLSMPGRHGIDMIREIRREAPKLPILVMTMHDEAQYAVRAIRAGAQGYFSKENAGVELIKAIRQVAAGQPYIPVKVAEQLAVSVMSSNSDLPHMRLSGRELEILNFLAAGRTVTGIANTLNLSVKTISTHKTNIMHKMSLGSISEMVQYALAHHLIERYDD
ncbi:MAG: response regulator [Burkholderiaceae bacterium]